ncbi:MAG: acyl-CoA dehydrogenase, partial [Alphaproteobacteria bacterium]|nr:acyl-CoA dehydrogenase [Alphaproteobacteria bacterium]
PGRRNDAHAVSLEHKLGIHGSPTCVMMYGEHEGAVGYLIGGEGNGLKCMFTMMNNARISVGLQGVALAERAYQHALAYAKERVQGFKAGDKSGKRVAIIEHADVRRMLLTMRTTTEASRALSYYAGGMIDRMRHETDAEKKKLAAARVDLLTPLVKAWSTDLAVETASLGIQVHGGMGFIEETGAAQYYRDARILPIYEGTNGIQSNDLVFRKVLRDGGAEAKRFIGEMKDFCNGDAAMEKALAALEETTAWLLAHAKTDPESVSASAVPYLRIFATVAGGYMMAKMTKPAEAEGYQEKLVTAQFFREAVLPQVHGLVSPVMGGQRAVAALPV